MGRQQGFTLIEIMVTLIIIGILASTLIPSIGNLGNLRLKKAARHLATTIRYLHREAMAKGQTFRLDIDMKKNSYKLSTLDVNGKYIKASLTLFKAGKLPPTVSIKKMSTLFSGDAIQQGHIHFMPSGFAEKSLILLQDEQGRQLTLTLNPITGEVSIDKEPPPRYFMEEAA